MTLSFTRRKNGVSGIFAEDVNELQAALEGHDGTITANQTAINNHIADKTTNPHAVTKGQVGLANVDNTADANKPVSGPQQNALNGKENTIAVGTASQFFRGDKTWQTLNKSAVGLGNVDNTTDANKPVSGPQSTAIAAKADSASVYDKATSYGRFAPIAHTHAHNALTGIDTDSSSTAIHHTLGPSSNQAAAGNHTHTPAQIIIPLINVTSTYTSMAAAENEWFTKRFRLNLAANSSYAAYGYVRYTCSVSTAGSAGSYLRCQWSTDNVTWQEFGTTSLHNVSIAAVGQTDSGLLTIPSGAKANIWIRQINGGGNGTASPVVTFFTIQFS